jgi:hypothetical protein
VSIVPPQPDAVEIRYASTDDEVIAIHRFLLVVAVPAMRCPVDPVKSLHEIIRVAQYEAAIMAIQNGMLVGTMGLMKANWWYGDGSFLTDRWHFCLPQFWHGAVNDALINEAKQIAGAANLEFIHQGKIRPARNGMTMMMPRVYEGT